jgi:hypothetical protein
VKFFILLDERDREAQKNVLRRKISKLIDLVTAFISLIIVIGVTYEQSAEANSEGERFRDIVLRSVFEMKFG